MSDLKKSIERVSNYYSSSYALPGTLSARDYVGDTTNDDGVPMPQGTVEGVFVTLGTADDGNTTVVIENETTGTTHTTTLEADTYTEDTSISLYFSEGDELSISVGATTTPADDANVTLHHDIDTAPMN